MINARRYVVFPTLRRFLTFYALIFGTIASGQPPT
jgi:hypothetical protein